MLDDNAVLDAARRLLAAERSRQPIRQLSLQYPANAPAPHGESLPAGQVILAGSFTRPVFAGWPAT